MHFVAPWQMKTKTIAQVTGSVILVLVTLFLLSRHNSPWYPDRFVETQRGSVARVAGTAYGFRYRQMPSPPISPPNDAELSAEWYDEERGVIHVFTESELDGNLYTLSYSVTPPPAP